MSLKLPENIFDYAYCIYNYIDIHGTVTLGALSGCTYFFGHNPGQRNVMTCAMKKRVV